MCSWMVSSSSSRRMTSAGAVLAIGALACSRSVGSYPPAARCGCAAAPNRMLSLRYARPPLRVEAGKRREQQLLLDGEVAPALAVEEVAEACDGRGCGRRIRAAQAQAGVERVLVVARERRQGGGASPPRVGPAVDDRDDAPRRPERVDGATRGLGDVDGRRPRRVVLVPGAGTVEAPVAQHDAARVEHRALVLLDGGLALAARRERDALGEDGPDLRRPRRHQQGARALAADAAVRPGPGA